MSCEHIQVENERCRLKAGNV